MIVFDYLNQPKENFPLNEKGKYVISKYRGSGCGVINPRSKRFELCIVFIIKLG